MKRVYLLFCILIASVTSFGQTIPGSDMENWRDITTGSDSAEIVTAPDYWFGQDSMIIGLGQEIGGLDPAGPIPDAAWSHQLFRDTNAHGGTYCAKILTTYQDTFLLAGSLSNAQASVHFTFVPPALTGITFFGGLPVTVRPMTVSAWVKYFPGKDTATGLFGGVDSGVLNVVAVSRVGGTIGTGLVIIGANSSWNQITANINYTDTFNTTDTLRITFSSSGGADQTLDSSLLYVDDVTMTTIPEVSHEGVKNVGNANTLVRVYPNPAAGSIYLDGPQSAGLICRLLSVNGQVVRTKSLTGNDVMDVSDLPGGTYFYNITDNAGKTVQRGNIAVSN